jgi:hypothetical protein
MARAGTAMAARGWIAGLTLTACVVSVASLEASARELASDGDLVTLTLAGDLNCAQGATVRIDTKTANYYDDDDVNIQRLADTARAILSFECPNLPRIQFEGFTQGVSLFSGTATRENDWGIESDAGPLEALALFYLRQEPDFFFLGEMNRQIQPFLKVPGIFRTGQFEAYKAQAVRMMGLIDGDTSAFAAYMRNPGRDLGSFEDALANYKNILGMIRAFAPNRLAAYQAAYDREVAGLKDAYWASRVLPITDALVIQASDVTDPAKSLLKRQEPEFNAYVDEKAAEVLGTEIRDLTSFLADGTLFDVSIAADFLRGMPARGDIADLPKTAALLARERDALVGSVSTRLETLYDLAIDSIESAGTDYSDIGDVMDTAFVMAEEFEASGFPEDGEALLVAGTLHAERLIADGLGAFQAQLRGTDLSVDRVFELRGQALAFNDLALDFPGFAAYAQAVEEFLDARRGQICTAVLKSADIAPSVAALKLPVQGETTTLGSFACSILENGNRVVAFDRRSWGVLAAARYAMSIAPLDGAVRHFGFTKDGDTLIVSEELNSDGDTVGPPEGWAEFAARMVYTAPTGVPDGNGVRECDRLAADPHDPHRRAAGIDLDAADIDLDTLDRALDACIAAVEHAPKDTTQLYQLGRVLSILGDEESAAVYVDAAAETDYPAALYMKAQRLSFEEAHNSYVDAVRLAKASGQKGYAPGLTLARELNPTGEDLYYDIPPPTEREMVAVLSKQNFRMQGLFNMRIEVVGMRHLDCFQMNATDFSCEYKPRMKCDMSMQWGGSSASERRGGAILNQFFGGLQQMECDSIPTTFGTFRKVSEGTWRKLED